jgi:anti-sigma B factor antagonist
MTTMKTASRQIRGVAILDLSGRIVLGEGSAALRDAIRDLAASGQKLILLNLADINYIDSSGLGELVASFATIRRQGGQLKLLKLTRKVHDLMQVTKLYTVFDVYNSESEAIDSFAREAAAPLIAS